MNRLLAVLVCAFLVSRVEAQADRWRTEGPGDLSPASHFVAYYMAKSNTKIDFWWHTATPNSVTVDLNLSYYGGSSLVATSIDSNGVRQGPIERVLFVGQDANGAGVIALVGFQSAVYKILARKVYPGKKFTGVGYSIPHKRIYVLESGSKAILRGAFDPSSTVLPTSLSTAVTLSQCGGLSGADGMTLSVGCETETDPGILLGQWPQPDRSTFWTIWDRSTGPVCTERAGEIDYPRIGASDVALVEGQTSITVRGKAGRVFEVMNMSMQIPTAFGVVGPTGSTVIAVPPLQMGQIYGMRDVAEGVMSGPFKTPHLIWGVPDTLSSGFSIRRLSADIGLLAEIGGDDMAPDVDMSLPAVPPSTPQQWSAWLLIGTEAEVQPVGGGQYAIMSNLALPDTIYWETGWKSAVGALQLAAPTDPALDGTVICFQWMIQDGAELRFSDVVGVMVRSTVWESSSTSMASSSSGKSRKAYKGHRSWTQANIGKIGIWLMKSGVRVLPATTWKNLSRRRKQR